MPIDLPDYGLLPLEMNVLTETKAAVRVAGSRHQAYDDRRQHIVASARELFLSKSFAQVSIRDLEYQTGFTRGALYYYFSSKDAIYFAVVLDALEHVRNTLESAVTDHRGSPRDQLAAMIRSYGQLYQNARPIFDTLVRFFFGARPDEISDTAMLEESSSLLQASITLVERVIRDGVIADEFVCDDPHFYALAVWGMMATVVQMSSDNPRLQSVGVSTVTIVEQIIDYHLHALGCSIE